MLRNSNLLGAQGSSVSFSLHARFDSCDGFDDDKKEKFFFRFHLPRADLGVKMNQSASVLLRQKKKRKDEQESK